MNTQIRKVSLTDIDQLATLFDNYRIFYKKQSDIEGAKKFLTERIKQNESTILIAEVNDELVGFTQLYPVFSSTNMKRLLILNDLFINALHRGKGISKQLIESAKQIARSCNSSGLMLETEKSNAIGNQLYPSIGFELNRTNNFYFWEC